MTYFRQWEKRIVRVQERRSGESTRLPPMWPGFDSWTRLCMWGKFVVGSRPCSERFFCRYPGFPLSLKSNISKFQFDLDYSRALYHESLKIVQAFPVLLTLKLIAYVILFYFTLQSLEHRNLSKEPAIVV